MSVWVAVLVNKQVLTWVCVLTSSEDPRDLEEDQDGGAAAADGAGAIAAAAFLVDEPSPLFASLSQDFDAEEGRWFSASSAEVARTLFSSATFIRAAFSGRTPEMAAAEAAARTGDDDVEEESESGVRSPDDGFMRPVRCSPELAAIVGGKPIPKTEIVSRLWAYIKNQRPARPCEQADGELRRPHAGYLQENQREYVRNGEPDRSPRSIARVKRIDATKIIASKFRSTLLCTPDFCRSVARANTDSATDAASHNPLCFAGYVGHDSEILNARKPWQ